MKRERKIRRRRRRGNVWICMDSYGFVWILVVPFLDSLKVGLVKP